MVFFKNCLHYCSNIVSSLFHHYKRLLRWISQMSQLQSDPPGHGQILTMAEIKLWAFFPRNNFNLRGCAGVSTRRAHHFTHQKEMLLLFDSNKKGERPVVLVVSCCQDWIICTLFLQKQKKNVIFPRRVLVR